MKLYMIRHGETDWNKKRKLQGQVDIPLNEYGRHLAELTAPALADVAFDIAYTSPLKRAEETARLVLGEREIPVVLEPRIMEISFGEFEGLCCSSKGWNIPDPAFESFFTDPPKYQPPKDGESFQDLNDRLDQFLTELMQNEDLQDKTILISTHGAALCGMLRILENLPLENYWGEGVHKNCAVTIVEIDHGNATVVQKNKIYYSVEE